MQFAFVILLLMFLSSLNDVCLRLLLERAPVGKIWKIRKMYLCSGRTFFVRVRQMSASFSRLVVMLFCETGRPYMFIAVFVMPRRMRKDPAG